MKLTISDVNHFETIYISVKENHFSGHCNGYVDRIEEVTPIVNFMTKTSKILPL